jgi:site-specific DNA-methyltransferase (adenine-specific)
MPRRRGAKSLPHLIWDGRSDPQEVPAAVLSPLAEVYPGSAGSPLARRLILGDNLAVMASLLPGYENRFDLIYADPPFLTGKSLRARVGRNEDSRAPLSWKTADGFSDQWGSPTAYLTMLEPRLRLMHRLLSPSGSLYLHLDWHASAYARLLLDEIFGQDRLLNEIAWLYHGPSPVQRAFNRKHDTLLVYTKSDSYLFNADAVRQPYDPATVRTFSGSARAGFGKVPDLERGKVPEDWWYFPVVARLHHERTGYPTQKPEALLTRVIAASSPAEGLVGDFFCGSGTTLVAAERLGRSWIGCDAHPLAFSVTHRRLLLQRTCRPYRLETGTPKPGNGLEVRASLERGGQVLAVRLQGVRTLAGGQLDREPVEAWEVDWDFDGRLFRSRAQAARAWRSNALADRLDCDPSSRTGRKVAVRAFDRLGRVGTTVLKA